MVHTKRRFIYGIHCATFHRTQNRLMKFGERLPYQIVSKPVKGQHFILPVRKLWVSYRRFSLNSCLLRGGAVKNADGSANRKWGVPLSVSVCVPGPIVAKLTLARQLVVKNSPTECRANLANGLVADAWWHKHTRTDGQTWSPHKTFFPLRKQRLIPTR